MKVVIKKLEKKIPYQGEIILSYEIQYPQIQGSIYPYGEARFNLENEKRARQLEQYANGELLEEAKQTFEYNKEHGYPIMQYELVSKPEITLQEERILSLYIDTYTFTGGAHGNTIRESQTWDLMLPPKLPLYHFYPQKPYFLLDILKEINEQIAYQMQIGQNQYFDNYCKLVLETFMPDSYYLTPKGITIFFQHYDIAPYSSGIPTFLIKN